jgi:hypothetical protein
MYLLLVGALALLGPLRCPAQTAPPALQITAPASGTVVAPGQTVSVTVVASGGTFSQVGLIAEYPIGFSSLLTAAPFQFSVTVPANAGVGTYHLTAVGNAGQSSLVESYPVTLYVERADSPTAIAIQPSTIILEAQGQQMPLQVLATFSDGTVQDVSGSSQLSYSSSNAAVATANARGWVSAVGTGGTSISVSYARAASAGVAVSVSALTTTASPASLSFSNTTTSTTSAAQPVIITNSSSANLTLANVTISGDFTETDNCSGQTIAAGGTCTINVKYAPMQIGQEGGQLTIVNGFDVVPLTVSLSGTGISATGATLVASLTHTGSITVGQSGLTYSLSVQEPVGDRSITKYLTVRSGSVL